MSYENKVVWSEGMFLRPQHFQQQERYIEAYVRRNVSAFQSFFWGFSTLEVDREALNLGTIRVRRAKGLLPDGTPFDLDADKVPPLAFDFPPDAGASRVFLVLPPSRDGVSSVIYDEDPASAARFAAAAFEAGDTNEQGVGAAEIQVGRPRFRLMLEADVPHGWSAMGMVRVIERRADNVLRMDTEYIPPTLHCGSQERLIGFIREIASMLTQRGDTLATRLSTGGRGGVSEIGDFLTLMLINRWRPLLTHLEQLKVLHPERLYANLVCLAGEVASFSDLERRPTVYDPPYVHDSLHLSFAPVLIDLRRALATVLDQTVISIELQERKYGIKLARIPDRSLLKQASFVLAAHANLPPEQIQLQLPAQIKIGPIEKIRDLINLQLPGVVLRPLPVAPRELPYHAGYNYFEFDTQHDLWKEMEKSAGVALYIAGDFPGLALECWAIRNK